MQKKSEIKKILMPYLDQYEEEEKNKEKAIKAILRFCKKYYPNDHTLTAPDVLAKALEYFDLEEGEVGQLYLEWTVNAFITNKIIENIPKIDFIYNKLIEHKITEKKSYEYNDLDNHLFYIPVKETKSNKVDKFNIRVFAMTTQNSNYLFVRKIFRDKERTSDFDQINIYRYWDKWKARDDFDKEEEKKYKKEGINLAILHAEWLVERYSDNVKGLLYGPDRPDLQYYKKNKFKTEYNDSRDGGFVCGYSKFRTSDSMASIFNYSIISSVFLQLKFALKEMKEIK